MKKFVMVLVCLAGSVAFADSFSENDSNSLFGLLSSSEHTSFVGNSETSHLTEVVCSWDRLQESNSCNAKKDGQNISLSANDSDAVMAILERVIGSNEVGAIANRAISLEELVCSKQNGETVAVCTYKKK